MNNLDDKLKEIYVKAGYLGDEEIGRIKAVFASQRITLDQEAVELLENFNRVYATPAEKVWSPALAEKIYQLYVSQVKGKK